jgi:hypothetical protein
MPRENSGPGKTQDQKNWQDQDNSGQGNWQAQGKLRTRKTGKEKLRTGNWQGLRTKITQDQKLTQDQNNSGPGKLRTRKLAGQ